ncbi:hypothetical protein MNV49_003764 [Pseudohyphozyma bogoriensis]|nr:hypothetical protein MNV49_003764 [Pseudohyphozyma bogoriensis]
MGGTRLIIGNKPTPGTGPLGKSAKGHLLFERQVEGRKERELGELKSRVVQLKKRIEEEKMVKVMGIGKEEDEVRGKGGKELRGVRWEVDDARRMLESQELELQAHIDAKRQLDDALRRSTTKLASLAFELAKPSAKITPESTAAQVRLASVEKEVGDAKDTVVQLEALIESWRAELKMGLRELKNELAKVESKLARVKSETSPLGERLKESRWRISKLVQEREELIVKQVGGKRSDSGKRLAGDELKDTSPLPRSARLVTPHARFGLKRLEATAEDLVAEIKLCKSRNARLRALGVQLDPEAFGTWSNPIVFLA